MAMSISTCCGRGKPSKSKKGGAKGSVALLEESTTQLSCVSQNSHPIKSIPREQGKLGSNTPSNFPRALGTKKKFGKERIHREELSKSVNHMSEVFARQNLWKDHMRKPCTKNDAPAEYHGTWRKIFTSSRVRTKLRLTLLLKPGQCRRPLRKDQKNQHS